MLITNNNNVEYLITSSLFLIPYIRYLLVFYNFKLKHNNKLLEKPFFRLKKNKQ